MVSTPAPLSTSVSQLDDASKSCVIVIHSCNSMRPSICWLVGSGGKRHAIVF
jgi:hypothetical protein